MQTSTQDTGNYVRPTPKEIAFIVKELRRHFELKQLSLAADAGVTERTIERIEAEIPVSADTLRRVAGALKLREGAFTDPRYCPSQADVMTEVEKIRKERTVTDLQDLSDARDLENIMGQDGHLIDGSAVESSLAEALAVLKDQVQDWGDIFGDIPNVEKLLACQQVLASIREIEGHGYTARWGRYITDDKCSVGVLVFFKTAGPQNPRRAIVPRW